MVCRRIFLISRFVIFLYFFYNFIKFMFKKSCVFFKIFKSRHDIKKILRQTIAIITRKLHTKNRADWFIFVVFRLEKRTKKINSGQLFDPFFK